MKQTLILLGLAAGVLCDPTIKSRLGQVKAKTLAEQDLASAPACTCAIPAGAVGVNPTGLNQGVYNTWEHSAAATVGETVQTIPDVAQNEVQVSQTCACSQ